MTISSNGAEPHHELIDLGQRRLYLSGAGAGRPTVILEGGLGSASDTWASVQSAIAEFTSVYSYDRAGLGRSDPAPTPRTCQALVNDLHELLTLAAIAPPYILVGHSLGGLIVRLFAAQQPATVAGMVLVDSSHEDKNLHFEAVLSESLLARNNAYLNDPARNSEQWDVLASNAQVRSAQRLFDFPVTVLARGLPDAPSAVWPSAALQEIEVRLQRELTNISTRGTFVLAEKSGHFIQRDEPELVVAAIRRVVEMARQGGP